MRRVSVKQSNPEIPFQGVQFSQQRRNRRGVGAQGPGCSRKFFPAMKWRGYGLAANPGRSKLSPGKSDSIPSRRQRYSAFASATISACCRLRCDPRMRGMTQKLHG